MSEPDSDLRCFIRQVHARSREHSDAMRVVFGQRWYSVATGILRQELDSMLRVIYLLSERDRDRRADLINRAVSGRRWDVRDEDMVKVAERLPDRHWARQLYNFGSGFIHLSRLHDYQARDPFRALLLGERRAMAKYLRDNHGGEVTERSSFDEVIPYVPEVLRKITSRLDEYLDDLGNDRALPSSAL